jgi:ABC-2 type transport system ATP-binding protein
LGAAIRTWELAKSYRRRPALLGIDLEVPDNVVFGYLGPNGAGKTTTIRLLVGLLRPTGGRAELLGMDTVRERDEMQRRIGYLPGEFVAYPDLTGEEYLRYLANLRGGVKLVDRRGHGEAVRHRPDGSDRRTLARQPAEGGYRPCVHA